MSFDEAYIHKVVDKIQFGIMSNEMIEKMSVVEIKDSKMSGPNTVYAPELGSTNEKPCVVCANPISLEGNDCPGHFGHIKLNYPIANPLFKEDVASYAMAFCNRPMCARLVVTKQTIVLENLIKKEGQVRINAIKKYCENVDECPHCKQPHGHVKYYSKDNKFMMSYNKKDELIPVSYKLLFDIFNNIKDEDLIIMGFNKDKLFNSRPSNMIIKNLLVLPTICRNSVKSGTVECHDDITYKYIDIIKINNKLTNTKDLNERKIAEYIEALDFNITMIMDNTRAKVSDNKNRMIKCIHSRIKGKNGLIRKHMCGKRVDFCGRTVIGPEPNSMVDEMVIPREVAENLTFPVRVNAININQCYEWIEKGKVNFIIKEEKGVKSKFNMKFAGVETMGTKIDAGDILKINGKVMTYEILQMTKGKVIFKEGDLVLKDGSFIPIIPSKKKTITLKEGYIVERQLMDGDWVLLNRQPSLRAESLRAKKIKILPCKTFRFNLASTEAFNADFDGDEMNIWLPQSYESLAELIEICSVEANFTTSQHSRPIIAMKQDAMTGGYLLTYGDIKIDKATFFDCLMIEMDIDIMAKYDHIREVYRWKGIEQEVIDKLLEEKKECMKKNDMYLDKKMMVLSKYKKAEIGTAEKKKLKESLDHVKYNIEIVQKRLLELRDNFEEVLEEELMFNGRTLFSFVLPDDFEYNYQNDMDPNGKPVYITRGVMLSGTLNKSVMGSASGSISHMIRLNYSSKRACDFVSFYQMIINRWLLTRGFSVGIEDCIPKKSAYVKSEANKCFSQALLHMQTEEDEELRELKVNNSLNNARDVGQKIAKESLDSGNSFVAMIRSGAKGNDNNITQITSMLGQQNSEGKRMPQVFGERTLPHFQKDLEELVSTSESSSKMLEHLFASRGFVHSGFYKGLTPGEFFFHAVGGREGLIDTAVKTATTGYIQRKMVKLMEDLQVTYKGTVEDASKNIISFDYGGDNFDGAKIIYRGGEALFMDIDSIVNKLNADHEWEEYNKNKITEVSEEMVVEEEKEEEEMPFEVNDIELFYKITEREKNDKGNKVRELILENISKLPNSFLNNDKYGDKWNEVRSKWIDVINLPNFSITRKAGRKNNYDFDVVSGDTKMKVEFKYNCKSIDKLPQFLSLGSNSDIFDVSYAEYFYDNYLPEMLNVLSIESEIPSKEFYKKKVHSADYDIHPMFKELHNKIKKTNEETNEKINKIVNDSITMFLKSNYKKIDLELLETRLAKSLDKVYIMWDVSSRTFYKEELKDEFNNFKVKNIKNNNTIIVSSSDIDYKLLLRWRNNKGVLYPAWQISLEKKVK